MLLLLLLHSQNRKRPMMLNLLSLQPSRNKRESKERRQPRNLPQSREQRPKLQLLLKPLPSKSRKKPIRQPSLRPRPPRQTESRP